MVFGVLGRNKKKDRKERVLSSGLHGMWFPSLNCTISNKETSSGCPGWLGWDRTRRPIRHCTTLSNEKQTSFDNLDGDTQRDVSESTPFRMHSP
jgi:hypothetical protein